MSILTFEEIAGAIYDDYFSPDEDDCTVYDLEQSEKEKGYKRVCEAQHKADREEFQKQKQEMYSEMAIIFCEKCRDYNECPNPQNGCTEVVLFEQKWGVK